MKVARDWVLDASVKRGLMFLSLLSETLGLIDVRGSLRARHRV
jgi:hypothetical protein